MHATKTPISYIRFIANNNASGATKKIGKQQL